MNQDCKHDKIKSAVGTRVYYCEDCKKTLLVK